MLLLQWNIFHDLRITVFYGTFTLLMEITLELRFGFVRHFQVFFIPPQLHFYLFDRVTFYITLELRYILVRSNYMWK